MRQCWRLLLGVAVLLQGCTTIGVHNPRALRSLDFGPPEEVRFCVLLEEGISQDYAEALLLAWNTEEGKKYNPFLRPVSFERHKRGGFTANGIIQDVLKVPLRGECDKVVFFVGRHLGDMLYGIATLNPYVPLPELVGAVNAETTTHGFVIASLGSPNQLLGELLFFQSRHSVTIHELYHFFGCGHSYTTMDGCYKRIHTLKATYRDLKSRGYYEQVGEELFFPTLGLHNAAVVLTTRREVNTRLEKALK
jgi:hypothetical protein